MSQTEPQTDYDDNTAQELAMEVVITRTISVRQGMDLYMNLIGFVGIERASELTKQAQEILTMVTPKE